MCYYTDMIVLRLIKILFLAAGVLFLIVVVLTIKDLSCSTNPYVTTGWSPEVLDVQKGRIIAEFPWATNEERSEILRQRAEKERLELVREGILDPDWRPPRPAKD